MVRDFFISFTSWTLKILAPFIVAKRFEAIDPSKILSVSNPKVFPKNDFLLVPIKTGYPRAQILSILLSNLKFWSKVFPNPIPGFFEPTTVNQ